MPFCRVVIAFLALLAMAPPARTAENALMGKWEITDATAAPWTKEKDRAGLNAEARRLIKQEITFRARDVQAKHGVFVCKLAEYQTVDYSPDALFRGSLPEPHQERMARALGLPRGDVPSVDVNCATGDMSYHFRDKNIVLVASDDVIYTLTRR